MSTPATSILPVAPGVRRDVPDGPERLRLPLAIPALDAFLAGGLPCGVITEIFGNVSSGRTTLAQALLLATTRAGECAAWVDLPNALDPDAAARAGVDLARVLWVCPADWVTAFRAVEQVLETGGFRLVVLDLEGPLRLRCGLPASAWLRVARAAARREAAIVVLSAARLAGAFATLSLEACPQRRDFVGEDGPCPVFAGATSSLYLRKYKFGPAAAVPVEFFASAKV